MCNPQQQTVMIGGIECLDLPLSSTILVGGSIVVSGHVVSAQETGTLCPGTFGEEAELAFATPQQMPEAAGSYPDGVVGGTAYWADLRASLSLYSELHRQWFAPLYPIRTTGGADLGDLQIELGTRAQRSRTGVESVAE